MKTIVTITLTSIFIISNFVAQAAGFTTLSFYSSEGNAMEILMKTENTTCEYTPGYNDHVFNHYAEKTRIIQMPDYTEELVENTPMLTSVKTSDSFVAETTISEILPQLRQEEPLVESEISELNTREIFKSYKEEKIREQLSIQILAQFTKSEKEVDETLPSDNHSPEPLTK